MIQFDSTVSLGTIFQIIAIVGCAGVLYSRLTALEVKMEPMWAWFTREIRKREDLR